MAAVLEYLCAEVSASLNWKRVSVSTCICLIADPRARRQRRTWQQEGSHVGFLHSNVLHKVDCFFKAANVFHLQYCCFSNPRHLQLAIRNDDEINKVRLLDCSHVAHIHAASCCSFCRVWPLVSCDRYGQCGYASIAAEGGVMPSIHHSLLPKKTSKSQEWRLHVAHCQDLSSYQQKQRLYYHVMSLIISYSNWALNIISQHDHCIKMV